MRFTGNSTGRIRLAALLAAALLLTPLCGFASSASAIPTYMRVGMVSPETETLHPLTVMNRDLISVLDLVYESLVELNDDQEPVPSLAESWEVQGGGKTWIFHIRDGVYFHDGRKLTAYDVKATMDVIKQLAESGSANNEKGIYWLMAGNDSVSGVLTSWEAEDNLTLRVQTSRPYYGVLYAMTFPIIQAQSAYDENPPGTGPYRVDYYTPGEKLALTANLNWWGQTPYVSSIDAICYKTDEEALQAFEAEEIDILATRSTTAVRYRGVISNRINSYDYGTRQLECLMINNGASKLNDQKMRRAIMSAINKSRLVTSVYQGIVTTTDTLQIPGTWLYKDPERLSDGYRYGYDPDRANALLDELGWDQYDDNGYRCKMTDSGRQTLTFRLNYYNESGNALRKEAALEIQTMLKAVGIKTTVSAYSFENGQAKLKSGDYDLFLCAYNFDVTPDPTFCLLSNGYGNYARYRSDAMSKLLTALRKAPTVETDENGNETTPLLTLLKNKFQQDWYAIQDQMAEDGPFMPLYWRNGVVLTRYPYSSVRDIREFELLNSIESYR